MKEAYKAMRLMSSMVVACILAVWIGNWLDEQFHSAPLCLLLLLAYAIGASLYSMVKKLGDDHE